MVILLEIKQDQQHLVFLIMCWKHLVKICIALAIFIHQYDAIVFDCLYSMEDWVILDKVYGCTVKNLKIQKGDTSVIAVTKDHLKGKTSKDVETLNIENSTCTTIPKNIEKSLPNLKGLRIAQARLQSIESDDLKPFPALRILCLWANQLQTLDGNLLINNPKLEFLNFGSNHIRHVGPNFLDHTKNLIAVYFEENTCTNHTNQFAIDELKHELAVKCPPSFQMVEIALINSGKLATKNDDFENKIKLLEDRISELEQHARK
ncbi:CLUMA_CG005745, isoform A [Clunio marinus]|uniref:CLUMA_CG005745, isoform A n=1 Tax=Clunio marinus TaxID=568069 RepID=A0A1J1HVP6_9DIPT|nr:CLUMA_CG005745, isoform A [Clunio marinus]